MFCKIKISEKGNAKINLSMKEAEIRLSVKMKHYDGKISFRKICDEKKIDCNKKGSHC